MLCQCGIYLPFLYCFPICVNYNCTICDRNVKCLQTDPYTCHAQAYALLGYCDLSSQFGNNICFFSFPIYVNGNYSVCIEAGISLLYVC